MSAMSSITPSESIPRSPTRWLDSWTVAPAFAPIDGLAGLTLDAYRFLLGDVIYLEIFARSFFVAGLTTLICILLAYPLAWLIARSPKKRRDLLVLLVILPFASNFLVRIYAWIMILGPASLLYTPFAVIVGLVYTHLPFMLLPLYTNLEKHDPALLEAAQDLGAGAWTRFWRVTFPLLSGESVNSKLEFQGILSAIGNEVPEDDFIMVPITVKVTGAVTFTAGS